MSFHGENQTDQLLGLSPPIFVEKSVVNQAPGEFLFGTWFMFGVVSWLDYNYYNFN